MRGRGAAENPANRFDRLDMPWDGDWLDSERLAGERGWEPRTEFFRDTSKSILSRNDSPDLGFRWSVNPYRGCEHGCSYCYARPSHEYLGFSAGLEFESRIMVKLEAPALLEARLRSRGWEPEPVVLSGNTDCYQPVEKKLEVTRRCLQVFRRLAHPVDVITKNALVLRDRDILGDLASRDLTRVLISITTLDPALAASMEPRASSPKRRLEAIAGLTEAGIPVGVSMAPVIPGLNDHEIPAVLSAAADAGAVWAQYILLRLPHGLRDLFSQWLERCQPTRREKVLGALRQVRSGDLNDSRFGLRMRGEGPRADAVTQIFALARRRAGLERLPQPASTAHYDPTAPPLYARDGTSFIQQELFGEG